MITDLRVLVSDKKTSPIKLKVCLHTKISGRGRLLFLINRFINQSVDSFAIIIVLEELHKCQCLISKLAPRENGSRF